MQITNRNRKKWTILDISGNIRKNGAQQLKDLCEKMIAESRLKLAVNFKEVDFIDSIGLGALISCNQTILASGGQLVLVNLNENIYSLLEMTSTDKMFKIFDSEKEIA
ncbi:STAS domain-containing protein [Fibrobacterota bacterium]